MTGLAVSLRRGVSLVPACLFFALPAAAWDVSIGTQFLENALYVESWSGPGFDWTTLDERVRASEEPGPTVPIVWTTQSWDPELGEWPVADLQVSEGVTFAVLYNDETTTERWTSAEAAIFGTVQTGRAVGAGVAYDFEFVVQPFTSGTLVLDAGETYARLASDPGDVGTAFANVRLYRPDVDINAPGGSNFPLAQDAYTLAAGAPAIEGATPSLEWSFQNSTGVPQSNHLRLELSSSVLAVPEPGLAAGILAGALALGGIGRRARSRARS